MPKGKRPAPKAGRKTATEEDETRLPSDLTKATDREIADWAFDGHKFLTGVKVRLANDNLRLRRSRYYRKDIH